MADAATTASPAAGAGATAAPPTPFLAELQAVPATDFMAHGTMVQLHADCPVDDALKTMAAANVTSAPVHEDIVEALAGSYPSAVMLHDRRYLGFVDVADVAALVLAKGLHRATPAGVLAKIRNAFTADVEHRVDHAVNLSKRNPFYGLPLTGNLAQATLVMAKKGVHRVAVIDKERDNRVVGVISQSAVVRRLHDNPTLLGAVAGVPVGSLVVLGVDAVKTALVTQPLREVLDMLLTDGISGCPLVDAAGAVVTTVSVSDVRALAGFKTREAADAVLDQPAGEALASLATGGATRAPVVVSPSDSLATAVSLVVASHVHRVFVVDGGRHPVGIITLTDILRLVCGSVTLAQAGLPGATAPTAGGGGGGGGGGGADGERPTTDIPLVPGLGTYLEATAMYAFVSGPFGCGEGKLVDVPETASASAVLKALQAHNVSAAAVYREIVTTVPGVVGPTGLSAVPAYLPVQEKQYVGWIDAADVAALALDRGLRGASDGALAAVRSLFCSDTARSAKTVANLSQNNPFWAVVISRPLAQVVRVLAACGVHRLAIVDPEDSNHVVGLVTQSAVARFLHAHADHLGALGAMPVSHATQAADTLVTCRDTDTLRTTLAALVDHRLTGCPVVDGSGAVVGAVSVSDIRALARCSADAERRVLELPVPEALKELRASAGSGMCGAGAAAVTVRGSDAFATALALLVEAQMHRVFVVDDGNKPVGMFTLTDALRAVAQSC